MADDAIGWIFWAAKAGAILIKEWLEFSQTLGEQITVNSIAPLKFGSALRAHLSAGSPSGQRCRTARAGKDKK